MYSICPAFDLRVWAAALVCSRRSIANQENQEKPVQGKNLESTLV